jgi:hypothetical protein
MANYLPDKRGNRERRRWSRAGSDQRVGRECVTINMNMVVLPLAKTAAAKRLRDAAGIASDERRPPEPLLPPLAAQRASLPKAQAPKSVAASWRKGGAPLISWPNQRLILYAGAVARGRRHGRGAPQAGRGDRRSAEPAASFPRRATNPCSSGSRIFSRFKLPGERSKLH